jgi:secondary thiamine-phosphate synthase enzyme
MSQAIPLTHAAARPEAARAGLVTVRSATLSVATAERLELVDLTERVRSFVAASGVAEGQAQIWSLHTTAGVFVNEWQEALLADMRAAIARLVPQDAYYRHNDPALSDCDRRNADAHLRNLFVGQNVVVPVSRGLPVLGRWQRVILAEFDGPNERQVFVQAFGI